MQPEWKEEFSSFESRVPIVLQKTFVFPLPVAALGITLTQHGITSKNILVGTALGQVRIFFSVPFFLCLWLGFCWIFCVLLVGFCFVWGGG